MSLAAGQQIASGKVVVVKRLHNAEAEKPAAGDLSANNPTFNNLFTSFWPELERSSRIVNRENLGKSFLKQTAQAELLEPWQKELFSDFVENYFRSASKIKTKYLATITEPLDVLLRALPHYHSKIEAGALADACLHYRGDIKQFSAFIDYHCKLSRDPNFESLQIGLRVLTRVGIHAGESPLQIIKSFTELLESPSFKALEDKSQFENFIRGLSVNGWSIASSLIVLQGALDTQANKELSMQLCALSALSGATNKKQVFGEALKPPVLEFLSLTSVPNSFMNVAILLYENSDFDPYQKSISASKLCLLLEVCGYNPDTNSSNVINKISNEILHGRSIDDLVEVMFRNIDKSAENISSRKLIERIIREQDFEEIARNIQLLRDLHNADVPYDIPLQKGQQNYFQKQVGIFRQALDCFDTFRRVRTFLAVINSELKNYPDGQPGVLASFAHEMADVLKVHCSEGGYPGRGIDLSNFSEENLFTTDPDRPDSPLHRYLDEFNCDLQTLRDFINSRFIITEESLILIGPHGARYSIGNEELCATFFAEGPSNNGANQCFLYPQKIINEMLAGTTHDFLDTPESSRGLLDLAAKGLYPENLVIQARKEDRLFFDIGSATNIGGLSNSTGVFSTSPTDISRQLDSQLGLQDLDPWGNPKKMRLLKFPELFEQHVNYHEKLIGIIEKLGVSFKILENRFAAWKKGNTPDNSEKDSGWINTLSAEHRHLRMLHFAYRWHVHLQSPERHSLGIQSARLEFRTLGKLHEGPYDQFYIDIDRMKLILPDREIQLPRSPNNTQIDDIDNLVDRLCFSKKAAETWEEHIRPYLAQLMPIIKFN